MVKQHLKYKVTNWGEYNKSLVNRGRITLWIQEDLCQEWQAVPAGKQGRPQKYSELAIELCLTLKSLFHLPYRATQGLMLSLFELMSVSLPVPCYTQMCRRAEVLQVTLKRASHHQGSIDIVVDSTGLKVHGEGEWKVRKHGASKRRKWKKLHLAVDPLNHEIVFSKLTDAGVVDDKLLPEILESLENTVERCMADGAYDTKACYQACYENDIALITPPDCNAVVQSANHQQPALIRRDDAVHRIHQLLEKHANREEARKQWKNQSDYHVRSIAETAMFRFKQLCGEKMYSRKNTSQKTEANVKVNILNRFTQEGMPIAALVTS